MLPAMGFLQAMFGGDSPSPGLEARVRRLERTLAAVCEQLGIDPHDPADEFEEVRIELAANRKIGAIKRYRELTGCGLAEAKAAVDAMEAEGKR